MSKSFTIVSVFAALGAAVLCVQAAPSPASRSGVQDPDEPVRDGKWLYTRNCAGCHNDNGDGKGATITQMGLQARDFKQGGFAFGDSREQMKRTISSGIPGRSPMPSFKGVLTDEELELVIDHVRTLMPPRNEEPPQNTELIVKDRPVIARGKLPPLAAGGKDVPRGLLIGTPEGMTFEYDLDDVKLLGVRLGRFADREDWGDRGGAYLKPLGGLVWSAERDCAASYVEPARLSSYLPTGAVRRVLTGTWVRGGRCGLGFDVRDHDGAGRRLAHVEESLSIEPLSTGAGFTREWSGRLDPLMERLDLSVTGPSDTTWTVDAVQPGPQGSWWTRDKGEAGLELVFVRPYEPGWVVASSEDHSVRYGIAAGADGTFRLRATTIQTMKLSPAQTAELIRALSKELSR